MSRTLAFILCIFLLACAVNRQATKLKAEKFDKQGHRGCRGLVPENTIPAMLKAVELGVTTLETDAVITRDGQVVLSHEPFFNHEISTHPDGSPVTEQEERSLNIYKMDYAQVKRFDVGLRPHPRFPQQQKLPAIKPLLADMIDSVEQYCTAHHKPGPMYNIETKSQPATDNLYHPEPGSFVDLLVAVIRSKQVTDRVIIQSFDPRTLQYLHEHYPGIKTSLLIEENDKKALALQLKALGFIPTVYSPHFSLVSPLLVKQCRDAGISLIPWTVNDINEIRRLRDLGVNGVISDFPDLFVKL
ncbi:MAG: glycerophosphodiester phosphodiesterase [Chitinophagaceae bacterium]|nr:glycerophosphodiester phosphodiesterase [Chitinophagaceae bacterium]